MTISRRMAWFFVAFALWNLYIWATFVWNVYPQHHFDGFFLVHAVIGGITSVLGMIIGGIGVRSLRRR